MKTIYTIKETRVSVYPRYELEPIGPEEILYCWNSGDSAVRFNGRDCDCPWVFRNVSMWTLEEVTYDDDGQPVERAWLYEKADECIA